MNLPVNFICRPYRGVSVQNWDGPLRPETVRPVLLAREAYRRTEFIVLRSGADTAVVRVVAGDRPGLFNPVDDVEWLGGPADCAYVVSPDTDTANATAPAGVAAGVPVPFCVVEGRYQHVNFIHRARPLEVAVIDVVPPTPSRLYDLARQAVDIDEDLPPLRLEPRMVVIRDRLAAHPDRPAPYLLPCQGGGNDLGDPVYYLDQRPEFRRWTLVGCERSRQFHRWFYGREADHAVEICPEALTGGDATGALTLLRCCLLERGYRIDGNRAVVPWGTNLGEVVTALRELTAEPARPAQPAPRAGVDTGGGTDTPLAGGNIARIT